jgi:hypothetical protein
MANYDGLEAVNGQVENESYCMKKSWQARNVDQMTNAMGYHDMADLANTPRPPTKMEGAKENVQLEPHMPKANMNDRKGKAF